MLIAGEACVALVHDFGSPLGAVVVSRGTVGEVAAVSAATAAGYFVSVVEPDRYGAYDRDRFIGTFDDWGWLGQGDPPSWYSGRPWGG